MNDKTIADVLDKSIDKLSGGAAEIAKAVKQVAPHAWEVAVRQQVAEGATGLVLGLIVCCALVAVNVHCVRRAKGWYVEAEKDCNGPGVIIALILLGVATAVFGSCAVDEVRGSALKLANPEYYAAKAILEAVK